MKTGRFEVTIDDVEVAGFQRVTLPSSRTETSEYREGDESEYERRTWGQMTFAPLTLERGFSPGTTELYDWREAIRMGNIDQGRKEITVTLMDAEGQPQIEWQFEGAWIKDYDPPELNAGSDEVETETVVIAYDKMVRAEA
ncbi:MAG: phage tail protein [Natrialbaceae archaeon]|nr:phage tail protein [Natrialbaceae archaeon]